MRPEALREATRRVAEAKRPAGPAGTSGTAAREVFYRNGHLTARVPAAATRPHSSPSRWTGVSEPVSGTPVPSLGTAMISAAMDRRSPGAYGRPGRPQVTVRQPEPAGPFPEARDQVAAAERQPGDGTPHGLIAYAQFDRVDPRLLGEFVERRLQRERARRRRQGSPSTAAGACPSPTTVVENDSRGFDGGKQA